MQTDESESMMCDLPGSFQCPGMDWKFQGANLDWGYNEHYMLSSSSNAAHDFLYLKKVCLEIDRQQGCLRLDGSHFPRVTSFAIV